MMMTLHQITHMHYNGHFLRLPECVGGLRLQQWYVLPLQYFFWYAYHLP